jgi:hypothetical protein
VWPWLPVVVTAVLVVVMYRRGYQAEAGSRAGAEPVPAGVLVALPVVALFMVETLAALGLAVVRSGRSRVAITAVTTAAAVLVLTELLRAFQDAASSDVDRLALGLALLLPLLPIWVSLVLQRPDDGPEAETATSSEHR